MPSPPPQTEEGKFAFRIAVIDASISFRGQAFDRASLKTLKTNALYLTEAGSKRDSTVAARCRLGSTVAVLAPKRARETCRFSLTPRAELRVSPNRMRSPPSTAATLGARGAARCATPFWTPPPPPLL